MPYREAGLRPGPQLLPFGMRFLSRHWCGRSPCYGAAASHSHAGAQRASGGCGILRLVINATLWPPRSIAIATDQRCSHKYVASLVSHVPCPMSGSPIFTPGVTCCSREQMAMRACGIFPRRTVSYSSLEGGNVSKTCRFSVTSGCYGEHRQSRCVRLAVSDSDQKERPLCADGTHSHLLCRSFACASTSISKGRACCGYNKPERYGDAYL